VTLFKGHDIFEELRADEEVIVQYSRLSRWKELDWTGLEWTGLDWTALD